MALWNATSDNIERAGDSIDPFDFRRRHTRVIELSPKCKIGGEQVPAVIAKTRHPLSKSTEIIQDVCRTQTTLKDNQLEGLQVELNRFEDFESFTGLHEALHSVVQCFVLELGKAVDLSDLEAYEWPQGFAGITLLQQVDQSDAFYVSSLLEFCRNHHFTLALDCTAEALKAEIGPQLQQMGSAGLILCCNQTSASAHPLGHYRALAEAAQQFVPDAPIWIRNTCSNTLSPKDYFSDRLLESSVFSGALLCDGIGDLISIETEPLLEKASTLAYNILQGARARISKTEFVACPSCGRTLFDLQSVTQTIRARTDHLKGVTIAIMGCIVNGPGEMADADFGYVGGAPGKINLYVGKECVKYNVPSNEALDRLIDLIKEHDKWVEPI